MKKDIGDRLSDGSILLHKRFSVSALRMQMQGGEAPYNCVCLTGHFAAGAQAPFAVNRATPNGEINPVTTWYYGDLFTALAAYTEAK